MLKVRLMPTLLYRDVGLVKGTRFDSSRRVGSLMQAVKVYNLREVDELVFLDISATLQERAPDFELVDDFADECFMPLTVGGGIRSVEDVGRLLAVGADKVSVNTAAVENPALVSEIAARFGSQCVVVSIDARRVDGGWTVVTRSGTHDTGLDPVALARRVQELGAGEILLTSVDRDGTMEGYDVELTAAVSGAVTIPVIALGGAGGYAHMAEAVQRGGASAVAAAAIFHFTQATPLEAKRYLREQGIAVRL
ncbi:MAG TPA: imidazole glycerol phosphate synthase cyclase subunit [Longimicrobium sp.]|nr:imidazole glycerol phosphate synthase cyclase subunit [Longimicrobium sp.]